MNRRAAFLAAMLCAAAISRVQLTAVVPPPGEGLARLPMRMGDWSGRDGQSLDAAVLAVLKPDDYLNRVYSNGPSLAGVFIGYQRAQTFGQTLHSPMNCLPGAGWQPVQTSYLLLGDRGTAKRVVIQKGDSRQLVLYWYQSAQRVEGSEYLSKLHLVADAFTSRRNDAALVRIIVPLTARQGIDDPEPLAIAMNLARLIEPHVHRLLFEAA